MYYRFFFFKKRTFLSSLLYNLNHNFNMLRNIPLKKPPQRYHGENQKEKLCVRILRLEIRPKIVSITHISNILLVVSRLAVVLMMIFNIHIGEPFQQLFPIITALQFALVHLPLIVAPILVSHLLRRIPPVLRPPVALLLGPPPLLQPAIVVSSPLRPVVAILFRYLRLVVGLRRPGRQIIMKFLFNRLFRRKPPLYGIKGASG